MPCAFTEIDPPTVKMSVDCIAWTAKRGCDLQLDVVPGGAALHRDHAPILVEHDAVVAAHVEQHHAGRERLAAHAVAHAGHRHSQPGPAGVVQRRPHVVFALHAHHAVHRRPVQAAGVVHRAATLGPRQPRRLRDARGRTRRRVGRLGAAVLLADGIGRQLRRAAQREGGDDGQYCDDGGPQTPAAWTRRRRGRSPARRVEVDATSVDITPVPGPRSPVAGGFGAPSPGPRVPSRISSHRRVPVRATRVAGTRAPRGGRARERRTPAARVQVR